MHYVILRDDDTSALTPVNCLERLYRPFLDRALPVNLAVIPNVATGTMLPDGRPEGFLWAKNGTTDSTVPIGRNSELLRYLAANPGFKTVQHGYRHDYFEFDRDSKGEIARALDEGRRLLSEAGLDSSNTFVAPYDKMSAAALEGVARRFKVVSGGWYELRRLPAAWLPSYVMKKIRDKPHWRVRNTTLLSHPGCLLSCHRDYDAMLDQVVRVVRSSHLTVLVTHWWEYFREGRPDEPFIAQLHRTAEWLASNPDIRVISFSDIAEGAVSVDTAAQRLALATAFG